MSPLAEAPSRSDAMTAHLNRCPLVLIKSLERGETGPMPSQEPVKGSFSQPLCKLALYSKSWPGASAGRNPWERGGLTPAPFPPRPEVS